MRPGRKGPRSLLLIASGCALGMAANLALGACAIAIFIKQSDGDGKGGGSPGEPPN